MKALIDQIEKNISLLDLKLDELRAQKDSYERTLALENTLQRQNDFMRLKTLYWTEVAMPTRTSTLSGK